MEIDAIVAKAIDNQASGDSQKALHSLARAMRNATPERDWIDAIVRQVNEANVASFTLPFERAFGLTKVRGQELALNVLVGAARRLRDEAKFTVAREILLAASRLFTHATILVELGRVSCDLGDPQVASEYFKQATRADPSNRSAYEELARLFKQAHEFEEALKCLDALLRLGAPGSITLNNIGSVELERDEVGRALEAFEKALRLDPENAEARVNRALSIPAIYRNQAEMAHHRRRFAEGLESLHEYLDQKPSQRDQFRDALGHRTNFYLHYHGELDRPLQRRYGELVERAVGDLEQKDFPKRPRGRRLRVGYVSTFFRNHSVGRTTLGFLRDHNSEAFEIYTYYTGPFRDRFTEEYERRSDVFRHLLPDPYITADVMRRDELDIAVIADMGMHAASTLLGALRVAPIQVLGNGHPVTGGLRAMDYFVSSALMEPEDADSHYTERLLRLPGIGFGYPFPEAPTKKTKSDFGFAETDRLFLCTQSLYKYLPIHDVLIARIAASVPQSKFAFLALNGASHATKVFVERMREAFAEQGASWEKQAALIPYLPRIDYLGLVSVADVFLDNPSWSGNNTALESLALEIPAVTWPGRFMRSRHAYAALKALELEECIATSGDHYVKLATEMAINADWNRSVRSRIGERCRDVLFDRTEPTRELERAFLQMAESR